MDEMTWVCVLTLAVMGMGGNDNDKRLLRPLKSGHHSSALSFLASRDLGHALIFLPADASSLPISCYETDIDEKHCRWASAPAEGSIS